MYVFTEWIPDVLVELSSITERFWQLTSAAAAPIAIRTKEYAEVRFWSGLVRWGAIFALTGALGDGPLRAARERQEQRIKKQRREASASRRKFILPLLHLRHQRANFFLRFSLAQFAQGDDVAPVVIVVAARHQRQKLVAVCHRHGHVEYRAAAQLEHEQLE